MLGGLLLLPGSQVLGYGGRVEKWLPVCCLHLTCLYLSGPVILAAERGWGASGLCQLSMEFLCPSVLLLHSWQLRVRRPWAAGEVAQPRVGLRDPGIYMLLLCLRGDVSRTEEGERGVIFIARMSN